MTSEIFLGVVTFILLWMATGLMEDGIKYLASRLVRARRRTRVTYRLRQGRLMLASTAPTRARAEALAAELARLLRVCVFYRPGGASGPAALIADYTC